MFNIHKNRNNEIKRDIEEKNNLYFHCIDFGFKRFETNHEEELTCLLKGLT